MSNGLGYTELEQLDYANLAVLEWEDSGTGTVPLNRLTYSDLAGLDYANLAAMGYGDGGGSTDPTIISTPFIKTVAVFAVCRHEVQIWIH